MTEMRDLMEALDASVRKAQAVARDTRTAAPPTEETPAVAMNTIPQAAIDAVAEAVHQEINLDSADGSEVVRECNGTCDGIARSLLAAALPHLMPGLYVSHERLREGTDSTIWAVNPDAPHLPTPMLMRTQANAALFDAVAALLPTGE